MAGPCGEARGEDPFDEVREFVRARLREQAIPSLAVAVARRGEVLWEEAFGWADLEARVPATPHTPYSLASITKPITATALMVLAERGSIDLDGPVNNYLGEVKLQGRAADASGATVRRVANHTSGLPLHYQFYPVDEPERRPAMDDTLRRYGALLWPPGERFQYSNLGYGVLDAVIERVSGKAYSDFMRRQVFLPLGMTRASVDIAPGLEPFAAARYGEERQRLPFYGFDHPGGSAVFCSAHDLLRFGAFHLKAGLPDQHAVLSAAAIDAMQEPTADTGDGAGYGVGWRIGSEVPGYRIVGHGGGMAGVNTTLQFLPAEGLAVVALANTSCDLPYRVADRIFCLLAPGYAEGLAASRAQREAEAARKGEALPPPRDLLGEWRGTVHTYDGARPLALWLRKGGDAHAQLGPHLRALVNDLTWHDGTLKGRMLGELGTPDAARRPHDLHLDLRLRGEALNGALIAVSRPGPRPGSALSHWVELSR